MTKTPSRQDLLDRIDSIYRRRLDEAQRERETSIAAIHSVDANTIEILASLLSNGGEPAGDQSSSPEEPRQSSLHGFDLPVSDLDENESSPAYGGVTSRIRQIVSEMSGEFTTRDVTSACEQQVKPSTVAGVLKKLAKEGTVVLLEQGKGKRPSRFRASLPDI